MKGLGLFVLLAFPVVALHSAGRHVQLTDYYRVETAGTSRTVSSADPFQAALTRERNGRFPTKWRKSQLAVTQHSFPILHLDYRLAPSNRRVARDTAKCNEAHAVQRSSCSPLSFPFGGVPRNHGSSPCRSGREFCRAAIHSRRSRARATNVHASPNPSTTRMTR